MPDMPDTFSPDESLTSPADSGSDVPEEESPSARRSRSTSRHLSDIDLEKLTPTSRAVQILIGDRKMEGYKLTELANELGRTPSWVSERLAEVRAEILAQHNIFPFGLTTDESEALYNDIAEHGVQVPVILGEHIPLIDGRHRWRISEELGKESIPVVFTRGLTEEQERALSISLNCARRSLSPEQKRQLVATQLMHFRHRSDRFVASICGVHHATVARIRTQIEQQEAYRPSAEQIRTEQATIDKRWEAPPEYRIDRAGALRPGEQPPRKPRYVNTLPCPHCGQPVALFLTAEGQHELRDVM